MRQYLENGIGDTSKVLLMTNRKSHMRIRLTPRSMTLADLDPSEARYPVQMTVWCVCSILVGAPRDNVTDVNAPQSVRRLVRPGVIYRCPITAQQHDCSALNIDTQGLVCLAVVVHRQTLPMRLLYTSDKRRSDFSMKMNESV